MKGIGTGMIEYVSKCKPRHGYSPHFKESSLKRAKGGRECRGGGGAVIPCRLKIKRENMKFTKTKEFLTDSINKLTDAIEQIFENITNQLAYFFMFAFLCNKTITFISI